MVPHITAMSHRFVCQCDAAFGYELFDVQVTEAEAEVEPDAMADDLCREPTTLLRVGCWW